jgi:tetratricopeptide (TPR) repeat protein
LAVIGHYAPYLLQEGVVAADSKAKFLQDAERYMLHGKAHQAIGEYLKIVRFDPNDVLILNTIGDLYLRQGKSSEANKYFLQVAENYVQNNFFLKAIAVYKKILNADPDNLEINSIVASLYAKQGLSIDARNQYMRVASLLEKEGRAKEQMDAYEKIVELDPANSTIQRKLAELYFSEGGRDKSHAHWTGAARAQVKAGDFNGAADSFSRAAQLDPLDVDAMRGFLDCCLKLDNPVPALTQLKQSVDLAPQNLDLRELLGHAHLANKDPETAVKAFQIVISMDDARYGSFFEVAKTFIDRNEYDQAVACLDTIIPTLISRRETERAVQLYHEVLRHSPGHILTMVKLASIYSATGNQVPYLEILDKIADHYVEKKSPVEALEYLEKILQANPESEKHRKLHRRIFTEAYPDTPYVAPAEPPEISSLHGPSLEQREVSSSEQRNPSEIVEVDLLINYGLRDKALGLLQSLEARDPYDKEVRLRLLSLYKAENKCTEAAEQCLLLAALHRRSNNEESALGCLAEARQLDPGIAEYEKDLNGFVRRSGIEPESSTGAVTRAGTHDPGAEVDLSSDLLDIFFSGDQRAENEDQASDETAEVISEAYPQHIPSQASAKPVQEQLQEVDFYIRLGFHDEALAKLNEIAKNHPGDPEVASRYEKLGAGKPAETQDKAAGPAEEPLFGESAQTPSGESDVFQDLEFDDALDGFGELDLEKFEAQSSPAQPAASAVAFARPAADFLPAQQPTGFPESAKDEFPSNEMFADLMEEFGALSDQEVLKESYEDHFSLGTAYRDMELNEEAIKEFQFALKIADLKKDAKRIVQCCGMLSTCFLKKGMPSSALRWCQTGLKATDISSHEAMALRYDMGVAHSMSGSNNRALECFGQIFGLDPGYRDVAQRIDEIKGGFERHAS